MEKVPPQETELTTMLEKAVQDTELEEAVEGISFTGVIQLRKTTMDVVAKVHQG